MLLRAVTPEELIPFFGMATGVIFIVAVAITVIRIAQGQIGQAIAKRIHGRGGSDSELQSEIAELREQVVDLTHHVAETEERLDFTERLLAGKKEAAGLPEGREPS